jgi:hypothetical protein
MTPARFRLALDPAATLVLAATGGLVARRSPR